VSQVEVTLKNSLIGCTQKQKATVLCLGLKKPGQRVILHLNPVVQGQINKVKHMLSIVAVEINSVKGKVMVKGESGSGR